MCGTRTSCPRFCVVFLFFSSLERSVPQALSWRSRSKHGPPPTGCPGTRHKTFNSFPVSKPKKGGCEGCRGVESAVKQKLGGRSRKNQQNYTSKFSKKTGKIVTTIHEKRIQVAVIHQASSWLFPKSLEICIQFRLPQSSCFFLAKLSCHCD